MNSNTIKFFLLGGIASLGIHTGSGQSITAKFNEDAGKVLIQRFPADAAKDDPVDTLVVFYTNKKGREVRYSLNANMPNFKLDTTYLEKEKTEFKVDATGKIIFKKGSEIQIVYCKDNKVFAIDSCTPKGKETNPDIEKDKGTKNQRINFPFPPEFFSQSKSTKEVFPDNKKGYYHVVIDANPRIGQKKNNTLYTKFLNKGIATYRIAKSLKVNSSLSVFIKNYSFDNLEDINISVNGTDYQYAKSLSDIYNEAALVKAADTAKANDTGTVAIGTIKKDTSLVTFLKLTRSYLDSIDALNINDLAKLGRYKENLKQYYLDHKSDFNEEALSLLNRILTWYPSLVSLNPIAIGIPDNDEVDIELKIKEKNIPEKKYNIGTYYVKGKAGVVAGARGSLFFTNLKNHEAYIDSSDNKAKLDMSHRLSVGIGASGIVSFRTGSPVTPSVNLGFFVPLDEEISPFGQFGPGINYGTKKVGLNLSFGLAFGKVNDIKARYKDIDMRTISNLDVNGITEKVWKLGWALSLGMRFNISSK